MDHCVNKSNDTRKDENVTRESWMFVQIMSTFNSSLSRSLSHVVYETLSR